MMTMLPIPRMETPHGKLFEGDCLKILPHIEPACADLIFADPPFNLGKQYSSKIDDAVPEAHYLQWCKDWIDHYIRILKPGGSFFLFNLPKWNLPLGAYLSERLTFRHWIAVDIKY